MSLLGKLNKHPISNNGGVTVISPGVKTGTPPVASLHKTYRVDKYPRKYTARLRKAIKIRDNYHCQVCHQSYAGNALVIHHINYDKNDTSSLNLVTLCKPCHDRTNYHRRIWYEMFWHQLQHRFMPVGYLTG